MSEGVRERKERWNEGGREGGRDRYMRKRGK